jgi:hypothetical protein
MHINDMTKAATAAHSAFPEGEVVEFEVTEGWWRAIIEVDENLHTVTLYEYKDGEVVLRYKKPFDRTIFSLSDIKLEEVSDRWPELLEYSRKFPINTGENSLLYRLGVHEPPVSA